MTNVLYLISISCCWVLSIIVTQGTRKLKGLEIESIKHFETVNYNLDNVHYQHLKANEFPNSSYVFIAFSAFERNFHLWLEQHKKLFLRDTQFRVVSGYGEETSRYDLRTLCTGFVEGDQDSFVIGHLHDGQFDGSITTLGETFHLEPSARYFSSAKSFHSIIFPASSVEFDFGKLHRRTAHFRDNRHLMYELVFNRRRGRRFQDAGLNTCTLHITADYLFMKNIGSGSEKAAIAEMVYTVGMADRQFRTTDFDQDGGPGDGIGFAIAAVTLFQDEKAEGSLASPEDIEITPYLVKWSAFDHSPYCLALLFTYRDFADGALGLAWVAEPDDLTPGGICSERVLLEEKNEALSFNSALVSFINFGNRVPRKASVITVTHELGHGFGALHDPDTEECSPGGLAGNYIMYARASDGNEPNNLLFSPCSKRQISTILQMKGPQCLIAYNNGSHCGNKIVEEGEECDCGGPHECDAIDKCCVARDDTRDIPGCTIRPGKNCSPVAGACCTDNCTFIAASQARVCQEETDCRQSVVWRCPQAEIQPNNVSCNRGTNTCLDGECIGSICALHGFSECECQGRQQLCHVCCNNTETVCTSTGDLLGRVIMRRPGSTCKQHRGYCDSSGQCITVDEDDELNKLRDTFKNLFSETTMNNLWDWIKQHWYYVVATLFGFCLMVALLKVTCKRRTSLRTLAQRALLPYAVRHRSDKMPHRGTRAVERTELRRIVEEMSDLGMVEEDRTARQTRDADTLQTRLQRQFPEAPSNAVLSAVRHSSSEQSAVDRLLAQRYVRTENSGASDRLPGIKQDLSSNPSQNIQATSLKPHQFQMTPKLQQ